MLPFKYVIFVVQELILFVAVNENDTENKVLGL